MIFAKNRYQILHSFITGYSILKMSFKKIIFNELSLIVIK